MFYFNKRSDARAFARSNASYRPVDLGKDARKRWAVVILNRAYSGTKKA